MTASPTGEPVSHQVDEEEEARRKAAEEEAVQRQAAEAAAAAEEELKVRFDGYDLTDQCAVALAGWLATNETITVLDLSKNRIGVEGARAFAAALAQNHTITMIYFEKNQIGDEGARAFAAALPQNSTLTDASRSRVLRLVVFRILLVRICEARSRNNICTSGLGHVLGPCETYRVDARGAAGQ
ncbi:hypothetical protein PAPYR_11840 [Paratrimastix pyriformis]|uniref:Uncharacterized protein n=1 Tax=Paratrimastix pyriformis TaxID=342808 RepID=A0ABQ8U705_9EUKA|nr:hypothetical protein PAPYR_11840 [Paratrimastix pyriformis]